MCLGLAYDVIPGQLSNFKFNCCDLVSYKALQMPQSGGVDQRSRSLRKLIRIRSQHTLRVSSILTLTQHCRCPGYMSYAYDVLDNVYQQGKTQHRLPANKRKFAALYTIFIKMGLILTSLNSASTPSKGKLQHQAPRTLSQRTSYTARLEPDRCHPQTQHQPQD